MRFCLRCRHFSGGGPLCTGCGRSFGGRLCRGKTRHLNPHDARFCNFCGTPDMEEAATSLPLGWVRWVLLATLLVSIGRWVLGSFGISGPSVQGLTGYRSLGVWIIEKLSHLLVLLFVFYFFSAFLPGEVGSAFRGAVAAVLTHSLRFGFGLLGGAFRLVGLLLLRAVGGETKKKRK